MRRYPPRGKRNRGVTLSAGQCSVAEMDAPSNVHDLQITAHQWGRAVPYVETDIHQHDGSSTGWAVTVCYRPPPASVTFQLIIEEAQE